MEALYHFSVHAPSLEVALELAKRKVMSFFQENKTLNPIDTVLKLDEIRGKIDYWQSDVDWGYYFSIYYVIK